jgi:hypothetical protein
LTVASTGAHRAAVIVPTIGTDQLVRRCVRTIAATHPGVPIIVLADEAEADDLQPDALVVVTGPITIAAKRNLGARLTEADVLAFIDSDAWPAPGWLDAAIAELDADPGVAAVGGPNVSPDDATGGERYVGMAHHSFLVDGWWTYRKDRRAPAKDVPALPSCNLVVRRQDYDALGGMREELFTAEDTDFCARLVETGRRIRFVPEVLVFHKDRSLRAFVVQRFVFGVAMVPLLRLGRRPDPAYTAVSFALGGFTVFAVAGPFVLRGRRARRGWKLAMAGYASVVGVEAVRHAPRAVDVPGAALAIAIGNLGPGVGLLARCAGLARDLRGHYRNDR